jgi:broad specificity phosphatase PhoE
LATGIKSSGINVDKIFTSPLVRAVETAQIVATEIGCAPPEVMNELIERDFGIMTGKRTTGIEELCGPDIIKSNTITYFLNPEGAETFPQLIERGQKVLSNLGKMSLDFSSVLLVYHGDIGNMIYCAQTGKDWRSVLEDFHFGNGELIDLSSNGNVKIINLEQFNH